MNAPILLVDDYENFRIITRRLFRDAHINHPLVEFSNGTDCLLYLQNETNPLPVITILDLGLLDMHGIDVIHILRRNDRTRGLCIFVCTVSDDQEVLARSIQNGADAFLRKPLIIGKFLEAAQLCGVTLDIGEKA